MCQISHTPTNRASQGNYFLSKRVYVDFFFQLNLLPPCSLCLQGYNSYLDTIFFFKKGFVTLIDQLLSIYLGVHITYSPGTVYDLE